MPSPLILIVEDNREVRLSARFVLEDAGFRVAEVESAESAMQWLTAEKADLLLLDMNFRRDTTSGEEGLRFLKWLQQQAMDIPVVAITAWSNTQLVVKAIQLEAADFIEKPWNNQHLLQVLRQQLKLKGLAQRNRALDQRLERPAPELVWASEAMAQLMQRLSVVAGTDANILLTGENGTGKSMLAHWVHLHSTRAEMPFIAVNMAAVPEPLFESEMFGHKKGAFTDAKEARIGRFELANGGTLFMDEIALVPPSQQAKLLRVLESGEYEIVGSSRTQSANSRIISASNCDLHQLIATEAFRPDLYYRLNTLEFRVPALRERRDDIGPLARLFVQRYCKRYRKPEMQLSAQALASLQAYHWPGNIRELSHVIERAVLLTSEETLSVQALSLPEPREKRTRPLPMMTLEEAELQLIRQALNDCAGNKQKAADVLGITKSSLYRRLEKYGLAD
jgi:DNA-binding NtrC family response regulator